VRTDPRLALSFAYGITAPAVLEQLMASTRNDADRNEKAARETLLAAVTEAGARFVKTPEFGGTLTCSWTSVGGRYPETVANTARYSDLVCFGHLPSSLGVTELENAFMETLMQCGKPVLLSDTRIQAMGDRIAIGWDGRLAASRAISAGMDFLEKAKAVEILKVQLPGHNAAQAEQLMAYLLAHGVKANQHTVETRGDIGEQLQSVASQLGCDMLVVGGYGHSWIGETLFGGVTEDLVAYTHLPILMAH
jgi:nucleotide-binding universal stress UspA family protein